MKRLCLALTLLLFGGCDCSGPAPAECSVDDDCAGAQRCADGVCQDRAPDTGPPELDSGPEPTDAGPIPMDVCDAVCGAQCCDEDEVCLGGATCVHDGGACTDDDDCANDSTCEPELDRCVRYDDVERDRNLECGIDLSPGVFRTAVQCEWSTPDVGDPYPEHYRVESMPLVVDFGIDRGSADPRRPSLVFIASGSFAYTTDGVIRILDGRTCTQQAVLAEPFVMAAGTPAIGDLDGDGRADIVAPAAGGGIVAWGYSETTSQFEQLFRSADTTASRINSLSIADVDGDGLPEVLAGDLVYAHDGTLQNEGAGQGPFVCSNYVVPSVAADVDLDGELELVNGTSVRRYDTTTDTWVEEDYWVGPGLAGFAAVADLGDFPGAAGDAPGRPEIAVVSRSRIVILSAGGEVVFGPIALVGGLDGGNPTVADFDGDGRPEVGAGTPGAYSVVDLDCWTDGVVGECASGTTDGLLWAQPVRDTSCGINGSTVFDFEGDGSAEVVYSDECWVRVFRGADGEVLWSARRSSGTWIEAPVVADVDGDFHAELVSGSNFPNSCPATDPSFRGARCDANEDCASGQCASGYCRCVEDADCGDPDFACTPPLADTPGTGDVCRAAYGPVTGVRVYSDIRDRWAASRPIWSQHAYSVTHVDDDGVVPAASAMTRNWEGDGLNNFRQNVQGGVGRASAPDATVRGDGFGLDCSAENRVLPLRAEVCARGLLSFAEGLDVAFYDGDPRGVGVEVCRTELAIPLGPGECASVECDWIEPPLDTVLTVWVAVDVEDELAECLEENNLGTLPDVSCPPPLQ